MPTATPGPAPLTTKLVVDCAGGSADYLPLSADELTAVQNFQAAATQRNQNFQANRAALVAKVKASTDPAVQALAQLLGIQ